jgi:hypothetical protein
MNEEEKANILRTVHHHTAQNTECGTHALFLIKEQHAGEYGCHFFTHEPKLWFLGAPQNTHVHVCPRVFLYEIRASWNLYRLDSEHQSRKYGM